MRAISPQLDPEQAPQVMIAEDQDEFLTVCGALVKANGYAVPNGRYNVVVLAFRPNDEERARLAGGADIYISLLTFGQPMQGIIVAAGKEAMAATYGLQVAP